MNCDDVRRAIDEGRGPGAEILAHAEACAACRRQVEAWRAAQDELAALGAERAPSYLHGRVMAHVREASAARPRAAFRLRWPAWLAPAVATGFVVVVATVLWQRDTAPPPVTPAAETPRPSSPAPTSVPESLATVGSLETRAPSPGPTPQKTKAERAAARRDIPHEAPAAAPEARPPLAPPAPGPAQDAGTSGVEGGVPGGVPVPRREEAEAAPRAQAREAKASFAAAPSIAAAPNLVTCVVRPRDGEGEAREIAMPVLAAPPEGAFWDVTVSADGIVRADTERTKARKDDLDATEAGLAAPQSPVPATAARLLRSLDLPPGRYRIERALAARR